MTAPRQILPGTTYLVTRRCTQREFLLRPSPTTNAIIRYVLAVSAARSGIQLHAWCAMSNHIHLLLTDPNGRLPEFAHHFFGNAARALNVTLSRSQTLWDDAGYNATALMTPEAVVDSGAYLLANPVAAGLVESGRDWPGEWTDPELVGRGPVAVERPSVFFRKNGPMPERAVLELVPPPEFTAEEFRDAVVETLADREREATAAVAASGRSFLGVRGVLEQPTTRRAASTEARGKLRPTIATRDKRRTLEELARRSEFLDRHRQARERFCAGARDVLFPAGTYWLRVSCGVACEPAA